MTASDQRKLLHESSRAEKSAHASGRWTKIPMNAPRLAKRLGGATQKRSHFMMRVKKGATEVGHRSTLDPHCIAVVGKNGMWRLEERGHAPGGRNMSRVLARGSARGMPAAKKAADAAMTKTCSRSAR